MTRARWTLLAVVVGLVVALPPGAAAQAPVTVGTPAGDVTVLADRLEDLGDDLVVATGNVDVVRGGQRLTADRVELNRATGDAVATGRVIFYDGTTQLTGDRIEYNFRTGTGVVYQAEVRAAPFYRLDGERMERLGESIYRVRRGTFTTCEEDPPAWSVRFGTATADLEDFVWGTGASFWVRNVPLIPFFPYFAAAIRRERQTGFLFPKLGTSSSRGFFAEFPFFWAISDSQDLTVAPDIYTRRGAGGHLEYRYVLSQEHRGAVRGFYVNEFLHDGDHRGVGSLRHDWTLGPDLTLKADANGVSDDLVLREYGDFLRQRSAQRVESNVFLTKRWSSWNFVADLFWYQDLTTPRPIELQRLPDLGLTGVRQPVPGIPGLLWELEAGLVQFVRELGSEGLRFDLHPRLSRPVSPGGVVTLTPFVGGRLTGYNRAVTGLRTVNTVTGPVVVDDTEADLRVRQLLEAGATAEVTASRIYPMDGRGGLEAILHTIEPRIGYLWITGRDKDRLPQFTELDRIGETSRVEYAVVNRLRTRTVAPPGTEPTRLEWARVTVGSAYDFHREASAEAFAELILRPVTNVYVRADLAHSLQGRGVERFNTDLQLALAPYVTGSIGSRYSESDEINFFQAALATEFSERLFSRLVANFDARTGTLVEGRVGFDVRFQCWAVTFEYVRRQNDDDELRFAVNLLGIGGPIRTGVGVGALSGAPGR